MSECGLGCPWARPLGPSGVTGMQPGGQSVLGSTQESRRRMGACRGWVLPGVVGRGALSTSLTPSFHTPRPESCSGCSSPALLKLWVRVNSRRGCRHRQRSSPGGWECGGGGQRGQRLCDDCLGPEGSRSGCKDGPREHQAQMDSAQGSDAEARLLFPLQPIWAAISSVRRVQGPGMAAVCSYASGDSPV